MNELGTQIILLLIGGAWAFFKALAEKRLAKKEKLQAAFSCLEGGVNSAYHKYVEAIVAGRMDGALTVEEKRAARQAAKDDAIAFAKTKGIDLVAMLGAEMLDLFIDRIVKSEKNKKGG